MFMMFLRLLFFSFLTVTNVAAAPHRLSESAITRRFAGDSGMNKATSLITGTLDANGNGNGGNGNNNTPGMDGNNNGNNGNGDLSGNTVIVRMVDSPAALAGVLDSNGNDNGMNGNGNTDGDNGHNNGVNGDGDESGNTIIVVRMEDAPALIAGFEDGNGNGNGENGNGNTNGEDGNNNGMNLDGDLSGNRIIVREEESTESTRAILSGNGNEGGENGNDNTNGEDGHNNGMNGNGDLSGNKIIVTHPSIIIV